ncbi:MAG: cytochrome c [Bryobacteraceae bacterium]|jgi:hypothetical protein
MCKLRVILVGCLLGSAALAANSAAPTFNKDVLPILQANCQQCHRPGEIAPMSLLTYNEARPWAKAIKSAVVSQKMPPWFADPNVGHFANDRRLSDEQIKTLASWVDNGAPEGNAKDRPAPRVFQEGWNLKPDMVIEMPKPFELPAKGTIDYQYILVKGDIKEDLWVKAAEMRPSNNAVLHHGKVWVRPPGSHWMENAVPGVAYSEGMGKGGAEEGDDIIGKFNPGLGEQTFDFDGSAKLIPKGSDFVFELHYTAIGKPATDTSRVGLVLAKNPPQMRYYTSPGTPSAFNLLIPANDSNAEVVSESTVGADMKLVYIQPHAHLRGKDFEIRLVYPTGEKETVFKGKFDFNWQLGYDLAKPIVLPKGTRIVSIVHYDNSANNPFNPDPTKDVRWGPQNWDEMQSVFLGFIFDVKTDIGTALRPSGPSLLPRQRTGGPTLAALADQ